MLPLLDIFVHKFVNFQRILTYNTVVPAMQGQPCIQALVSLHSRWPPNQGKDILTTVCKFDYNLISIVLYFFKGQLHHQKTISFIDERVDFSNIITRIM